MVHYQSIPAATYNENWEQDDTVKTNKSSIVRWIVAGAMMILFVGVGVVATRTYRSSRITIAGTHAAATLLRSTATTVAGTGGGDHCCAPATGIWSGVSFSEDDDDGNGDPYETCYYNCDLAALKDAATAARVSISSCYCWSKSYYEGLWRNFAPAGGNWQAYDEETFDSRGDDKNNVPQKVTFCGTPCQEFETQNIDGSVPICPP